MSTVPTRADGEPVLKMAERKKYLDRVTLHLATAEAAYQAARADASRSQCDGLVRRINFHLDKLEILKGRVASTYGRLSRREQSNGD